jgi:hypothetical protein
MNDLERLGRIYGAAGRELRAMLLTLDLSTYTDAKGAVVMMKTRELVKVMNFAVNDWAEDVVPREYAKAERKARTALEILGKRPRKMKVIDRKRKLIDDTVLIMIKANNSIPGTVGRYLAITSTAARQAQYVRLQEFSFGEAERDIGRLAAEAELKEKSRGWLSSQIRDFLRGLIEDDEFIEIGGRMYRMKKYAELVARTTMRESQTAAVLDLCNQYDNDLVQISDHGTDCDVCEEFEGNIYSISGKSPNYPPLEDEPPYHPNCKHSMQATSEEAVEVRSWREGRGETQLGRTIREAEEAAQWRNVR